MFPTSGVHIKSIDGEGGSPSVVPTGVHVSVDGEGGSPEDMVPTRDVFHAFALSMARYLYTLSIYTTYIPSPSRAI